MLGAKAFLALGPLDTYSIISYGMRGLLTAQRRANVDEYHGQLCAKDIGHDSLKQP
jgi:hypothetical protein